MEKIFNLLDSSAMLVKSDTPMQQIEKAGRNCYQSKSGFTRETAADFCKKMMKNQHYAMLEHGTFLFRITCPTELTETAAILFNSFKQSPFISCCSIINKEDCILYVSMSLRVLCNMAGQLAYTNYTSCMYNIIDKTYPELDILNILNIKEVCEGKESGDLVKIELIPQEDYYKVPKNVLLQCIYLTIECVCDRGVSHEIVRHRVASYAQESTRYCNYGKDSKIAFIKPADYGSWTDESKFYFERSIEDASNTYLRLLDKGHTPQEARAVLPNALKTNIIITMNVEELIHFFNLRLHGVTGPPHPDMKQLAKKMYNQVVPELKKYEVYNVISDLIEK